MEMNGYIKIIGVGAYLPDERVASDTLMHEAGCEKFGVSVDFLRRFSGIKERRFAKPYEKPSVLAIKASRIAIENSGIDAQDIDQVIFCGIDKDVSEPATAHYVANNLGATNADCFDLSNACHGVMSGLMSANGTIGIGAAENILLCTGETPSLVTKNIIYQLRRIKDKNKFKSLMGALTVGDSGGALVISKAKNGEGCQWMQICSRSDLNQYCYYGRSKINFDFHMEMSNISNAVVSMHKDMMDRTYSKLGWSLDSISKIYCHQAGEKPHLKLSEAAGQPLSKAPSTYQYYGNLTSATIPVNLYENPPSYGDRILLLGAGSGIAASQMGFVHSAL